MQIVRLLSLVLLLALGHAHGCPPKYVGPNGLECSNCSEAVPNCCMEDGCVVAEPDDCRACCTLGACAEPRGVEGTLTSRIPSFDVAVLPKNRAQAAPRVVEPSVEPFQNAIELNHGPPTLLRGREPPAPD